MDSPGPSSKEPQRALKYTVEQLLAIDSTAFAKFIADNWRSDDNSIDTTCITDCTIGDTEGIGEIEGPNGLLFERIVYDTPLTSN